MRGGASLRYAPLVVPLLLLLQLAAACTGARSAYAPATPPAEAAARSLVDQAVQFGLARDFDRLCAMGTSQCKFILQGAGTDTVPTQPPLIVYVTTVPNVEKTPGTWNPGGVLFYLCGLDGKGQPYHSQMLVFENPEGTGLTAMEPVFWGSLTIDGPPVAEPRPTDTDGVWQGCPN